MKKLLRLTFIALILQCCMFRGYSQVVINEYSCSNLTQFQDNYGKYEDWFELYNAGSSTVDLSGYYLSDDSANVTKWQIPAGVNITANGFRRFWTSGRDMVSGTHYHTNFRLTQTKNNSEFIVLADPSGAIVDSLKLRKKTHLGHSRGRTLNGASAWSIFTSPTINASNNTATPFARYADRPDYNLPAGFYNTPVTIYLSTLETNADIHYTLDGTEPGISSPIYVNPITIAATTVIKAITISADPEVLPSLVRFNTYFINENHTTVVVSVAGTQLNTLANGNSSLEPHGSFEYFNINGERTATTYGEFNKHGQDSWALSHRSIDFISRDEMAYNHSIEEYLFHWSYRKNFQRIILRAAGDDNYPADHHSANEGSAHLRDAYIHSLADIGGMHLNLRRSEKAVVYLNGQYWGVYDIREKCDDHDYTSYYYGQDKYNLQFILHWGSTWAEYGGTQAINDWNALYNTVMAMNMASPANYNYMNTYIDYRSLVDYVIVNSMTVCSDWLNWNLGWWRGLDSTGTHLKWGWILWDNDATFGHYINYTNIPNTTPQANPCNVDGLTGSSDPKGHMALLNHLRQNPEVNRYYITRQIDLWNTVFSCDNMLAQLDSTEAIIDPEMTRQAQRWNGTYTEWKSNVQELRDFISQRCAWLSNGFTNCYGLNGPFQVTVKVDPPDAGSVVLNSLPLFIYPWTGTYFGGIGTRLEAYANAGYCFDHWSSNTQNFIPNAASDTALVNLNQSDTLVAHFSLITPVNPVPEKPSAPQAYLFPSPSRDLTTVVVDLPAAAFVSLKLYTPDGKLVSEVLPQVNRLESGKHFIKLNPASLNLSPGLYILDFRTGNTVKSLKMIYLP